MLYLIRHGQSTNNVEHIIAGRLDLPLNECGRRQCRALQERMKGVGLDAVFCSGLQRASESAQLLCQGRAISPKQHADIMEVDFGAWQGLTFAQVEQRYPHEYDTWVKNWTKFAVPGGEAFRQAQERCEEFYEMIESGYDGKNVAIVAHQGILRVLLSVILNDFGLRTRIRNTGVVAIDFERGQPQLIFMNDFEA